MGTVEEHLKAMQYQAMVATGAGGICTAEALVEAMCIYSPEAVLEAVALVSTTNRGNNNTAVNPWPIASDSGVKEKLSSPSLSEGRFIGASGTD